MTKTSAERKREQRKRWRKEGYVEILVRVSKEHAQEVKDFAASRPKPIPPENPDQQELPL